MNWRPTRRNETRLGGQRAPMLYPLFHFSREFVSAKWTRDDVQSPPSTVNRQPHTELSFHANYMHDSLSHFTFVIQYRLD